MAQTIQIKRATTSTSPGSLAQGELAYTASAEKLLIGRPGTGTIDTIGGKLYTDRLTFDGSSHFTISTASPSKNLTLAPTGNLIATHAGTIDLSGQSNEIHIKDNEAASVNFLEGSASYLKLITTNSSEKVLVGQNFDVGGNFTVAAGSGNTAVSGTLSSTSDFSVNTNKFTVAASSGNTAVAGTLDVTGKLSADGAVDLGDASGDAIAILGTATFTPSADFDGGFTVAGSQTVNFGGNVLTNVGSPSSATDGATKGYVDAVKQALDIKDAVRVATTTNGTLASAYANGQTVDGVTLATDDRILLKDQSTGSENGIYTVNASGAPTRAIDADATADVTQGMFVFVATGTANAGNGFVLTTAGTITVGTTALSFTQFSGAGSTTAGSGLTTNGSNIFEVNDDNITLELSSDTVRIKGISATAIGDLLIGASGTNTGYTRLAKPGSDNAFLTMGTAGTASWTTTVDGGSFDS